MGTAIKHPVPDRVKPSFVGFDIRALWHSGLSVRVPVKNYTWRLNPVWHRMLYSYTNMATVGVKGWTVSHNVLLSQHPNKNVFSSHLNHCKLMTVWRSSAGSLQLQNTCLHSCCRFVSQRTSLMWQNAADDDLCRRPAVGGSKVNSLRFCIVMTLRWTVYSIWNKIEVVNYLCMCVEH